MSTPTPDTEWVTLADAARIYNVSEDTMRRAAARGDVEAVRFGPRLIRVRLASVTAAGRPL